MELMTIDDSSRPPVLYIDMDSVLVDFESGLRRVSDTDRLTYAEDPDEIPGIFALMDPMPGAIDAFARLAAHYDTYILSTASWRNPSAWSDKLRWVHQYLGIDQASPAYKRLILTHHKNLNSGAILIDDRPHNGADRFAGEWIQFEVEPFPDWEAVTASLLPRASPP